MTDPAPYEAIRDREVLDFIARVEAATRSGPGGDNIAARRRGYERMAAQFDTGRPQGIAVEEATFVESGGRRAVRRYWPAKPGPARVLYFHGGGFALGSLDSHDGICADIAATGGAEVVSVAYRLCPEHPHPAAYDDAIAAVHAMSDRPLILAGDSAGANLAAAAALGARSVSDCRLLGQVLIYPDLGGISLGLPSYTERADAPLLSVPEIEAYRAQRTAGAPPQRDGRFDPLLAETVAGAPPCFVSAAEHDPLRDDGPTYVLKLTEAGIAGEAVIEQELPHAHLRARHISRRAAAAFGRICDAIQRMAEAAK